MVNWPDKTLRESGSVPNDDRHVIADMQQRIDELMAHISTIPLAPPGFAYVCEHCGQRMSHPDEAKGCKYEMQCPANAERCEGAAPQKKAAQRDDLRFHRDI